MDKKTGLFSSRAFLKASSDHAYQWTGLSACCKRYGLFSCFNRLYAFVSTDEILSSPSSTVLLYPTNKTRKIIGRTKFICRNLLRMEQREFPLLGRLRCRQPQYAEHHRGQLQSQPL